MCKKNMKKKKNMYKKKQQKNTNNSTHEGICVLRKKIHTEKKNQTSELFSPLNYRQYKKAARKNNKKKTNDDHAKTWTFCFNVATLYTPSLSIKFAVLTTIIQ